MMTAMLLKESLPAETRAKASAQKIKNPLYLLAKNFRIPGIGVLIFLSFLATFVFAGMEATFAMWSERTHGWGPAQNGYLFAFLGILIAGIQGGLIGPLTRRYGEAHMIILGAIALAIGLGLVPFSDQLVMLFIVMAILAIGFSIMTPTLNSLISLQAPAEEQGAIMGATRSATILARVLGPIFAGTIFWLLGKDWPYWIGAALMVFVALLARRKVHDRKS